MSSSITPKLVPVSFCAALDLAAALRGVGRTPVVWLTLGFVKEFGFEGCTRRLFHGVNSERLVTHNASLSVDLEVLGISLSLLLAAITKMALACRLEDLYPEKAS
jgi:hypothetical protein